MQIFIRFLLFIPIWMCLETPCANHFNSDFVQYVGMSIRYNWWLLWRFSVVHLLTVLVWPYIWWPFTALIWPCSLRKKRKGERKREGKRRRWMHLWVFLCWTCSNAILDLEKVNLIALIYTICYFSKTHKTSLLFYEFIAKDLHP